MATPRKTPLDYIKKHREELVPVQVRLPKDLVTQVRAKLALNALTFTELMKAGCHWYLETTNNDRATAEKLRRKGTGKVTNGK